MDISVNILWYTVVAEETIRFAVRGGRGGGGNKNQPADKIPLYRVFTVYDCNYMDRIPALKVS